MYQEKKNIEKIYKYINEGERNAPGQYKLKKKKSE